MDNMFENNDDVVSLEDFFKEYNDIKEKWLNEYRKKSAFITYLKTSLNSSIQSVLLDQDIALMVILMVRFLKEIIIIIIIIQIAKEVMIISIWIGLIILEIRIKETV